MRSGLLAMVAALVLAPSAWAHPAPGATPDVSGSAATGAIHQTPDVPSFIPVGGSGADVSYGGGPILTSNRTHIIFWQPKGSKLNFDPGYRALVERFLTDVAAASHNPDVVFGLTGQYTDGSGHPAAYASQYAGAVLDKDRLPKSGCTLPTTAPSWKVCLSDSQLQAEIEHVVKAQGLPTTSSDVYFLVTPKGFGSCMDGTSECSLGGSLDGYCGYHQYTANQKVDYAFIPYNAVPGHCQSNDPRPNGNAADPALSTMGHELAEMVTDPQGDAWTDASGNEIADLCITTFGPAIGGSGSRRYNQNINGGHFYIQDLWSNATGRCEPRAGSDQASFKVTSRSGTALTFKATGLDPNPGGQIRSYRWDFGNGAIASGRSVSHRFSKVGRYPVSLRVTDSWDNWGYYARTVSVR
jgi:hypothetical protein